MRCLLAVLSVQVIMWGLACVPATDLRANSLSEFQETAPAHEPVVGGTLNYPLLAEAIFHETNSRRIENGSATLTHLTELDRAACLHAQAMVEHDFFAHQNPFAPQLNTPADRVRGQGLEIGFVAENIGEVFVLRYVSGEPVYLREEGGGTVFSEVPLGEPLGTRSYLEVARTLLDNWMSSSGHRRNILASEPEYFGSGCQFDVEERLGMPMLACVQLFFAPLP